MKRRAGLKSANALQSDGPCSDFTIALYGWECGKDKHWNQTSHGFEYSGRICAGSGSSTGPEGVPWFNGWEFGLVPGRGTGSYWFNPVNIGGPSVGSSDVGCNNCLIDLALAVAGCLPVVGAAANTVGCGLPYRSFWCS